MRNGLLRYDGKDPMNKFFKSKTGNSTTSTQSTGKLQTATSF